MITIRETAMIKRILFVTVCLSLSLLPLRVSACAGHMYFNPDELGFVGGTIARMAGLAPAAPVFDLEYPQMTKPVIGDDNEILGNKIKGSGDNGIEMDPADGEPFAVTGNLIQKNNIANRLRLARE